jgi:cell division septation protein DedD
MVESYVRTIHQAMKEVESALAAVRLADRRLKAQQDTTDAARRAWNISSQVYAMGGIDYMSLLDTQRNYHRYLDDFQKTRMDYFRSYIMLFQALGGGMKQGQPTAADAAAISPTATPLQSVEGIPMKEESASSSETFWQVELAGLYHRTTIGPAWRDLLARYPKFMEGRVVRPRLNGRIDENIDGQQSWHRLYVAKFTSPEQAEDFCQALKADQQRCRVVSSQSDDTVVVNPPSRAVISVGAVNPFITKDAKPAPSPAMAAATENSPAASGDGKTGDDLFQVPSKAVSPTLPAAPPSLPVPLASEQSSPSQEALEAFAAKGNRVAFTVQLGAFSNRDNAVLSLSFWKQKGYDVYVSEIKDAGNSTLLAVRTGIYSQKKDALLAAQSIRAKNEGSAVVVLSLADPNGKPNVLNLDPPGTLPALTAPAGERQPDQPARQPTAHRIE